MGLYKSVQRLNECACLLVFPNYIIAAFSWSESHSDDEETFLNDLSLHEYLNCEYINDKTGMTDYIYIKLNLRSLLMRVIVSHVNTFTDRS